MMMMISTCTMCPSVENSRDGFLVVQLLSARCASSVSFCSTVSFFYSLLCALKILFGVFLLSCQHCLRGRVSSSTAPGQLCHVNCSMSSFCFEVMQPYGLPKDMQFHFQLWS